MQDRVVREESGPWTSGRDEAEPGGWLEAGSGVPARKAQRVVQVPWLRRVLCLKFCCHCLDILNF